MVGLLFAIGMATRIARGEMLHDLLINELNHRVKNTLATVQSIASQTLRRTDNPAEAIDKFSARLVSLGRTHNVLSDEKWESAQVRELVDGALAPYAGKDGTRIHAAGPDLRLAPRSALTVAMALHELATNAAKYGALSNDRGQIYVDWSAADAAGQFRLTWREVGGPPVTAPARSGFGSKLIESGTDQIGGSATLEFKPERRGVHAGVPAAVKRGGSRDCMRFQGTPAAPARWRRMGDPIANSAVVRLRGAVGRRLGISTRPSPGTSRRTRATSCARLRRARIARAFHRRLPQTEDRTALDQVFCKCGNRSVSRLPG